MQPPSRTIRAGGYVVQNRRRLVSHVGGLCMVEIGGVASNAARELSWGGLAVRQLHDAGR